MKHRLAVWGLAKPITITKRPPAPALEERKVATVLFANLVGFTSRTEHMDLVVKSA